MEWTQFAIFFLGVFGLFLWNRAEGRADARHMDTKLEVQRNLMLEIHKETSAIVTTIREEVRDFHERLLEIERKRT